MANKLVTSRYGVTTRVDFKAWPTPSQVGTTRHPDLTPPPPPGAGARVPGRNQWKVLPKESRVENDWSSKIA